MRDKVKIIKKYKAFRNVRIGELLTHCKACDNCATCVFEPFCKVFNIRIFKEKDLKRIIPLKTKYVYKESYK